MDWVRDTGLPVILPVNFPAPPKMGDEGPALDVPTLRLKDWYRAPETPHLLHQAGVPFAFTSHHLESPGEIHGKIREAVKRGLDPDAALEALTLALHQYRDDATMFSRAFLVLAAAVPMSTAAARAVPDQTSIPER